MPKYIRPLFCEGKGPFRWVALSGDANDIAVTDRILLELFPKDKALARWITGTTVATITIFQLVNDFNWGGATAFTISVIGMAIAVLAVVWTISGRRAGLQRSL